MVAQKVKNPLAMQETQFAPWVRKLPWRREYYPLQCSSLENPMDSGGLVSYSPWGCLRVKHTE